jgi:hypothetical protein
MSYDDQVAKICRLQNAWEVEIYDPPKREAKPKNVPEPYRDPWKSYAFKTSKEVMDFLKQRLDTLRPNHAEGEYADGFAEATKTKT